MAGRPKPTMPRLRMSERLGRGMIAGFTFHEYGNPSVVNDWANTAPTQYVSAGGTTRNSWEGGRYGPAFRWATNSDTFTIPAKRFEGLGAISICVGSYSYTNQASAFCAKNDNAGLMCHRYSDAILYWRFAGLGNSVQSAANDAPLNEWSDIVYWYNGAAMKIYVNGYERATGNFASLTVPVDGVGLRVGTFTSGSTTIDSALDYFYVYNRALPIDEIRALNHDPFQMFRPMYPWSRGATRLYLPPPPLFDNVVVY